MKLILIFGLLFPLSSYAVAADFQPEKLTSPSGGRGYEEKLVKSFEVKKGGDFRLKADFGSVEVKTWPENKVEITVIKEADTFSKQEAEELFEMYQVDFNQDSQGVWVRTEFPRFRRGHRLRVHFDVVVPYEYNLDIRTASGSISVHDLKGRVELNTSGGSLNLGQIEGPITGETSGGSIRIQGAKGRVNVHTSGGSISIGETTGSVAAETSGGSISLDGVGDDVKVHTSGGSLDLKKLKGSVEASTSGGGIFAELLEDIDNDCYLETSGGD
ncbi:MAG: DUF4097 domain-containing protein, partial [candidate division KSB1 bacterium]|nr:DUF4097 domain-containing protein [candidate division KSB1 bacterium]